MIWLKSYCEKLFEILIDVGQKGRYFQVVWSVCIGLVIELLEDDDNDDDDEESVALVLMN